MVVRRLFFRVVVFVELSPVICVGVDNVWNFTTFSVRKMWMKRSEISKFFVISSKPTSLNRQGAKRRRVAGGRQLYFWSIKYRIFYIPYFDSYRALA